MIRIPVVSVLFLLLCILPLTTFSQPPLIVTGHPDFPPVMYTNGDRIDGVGPEIVAHILRELHIPFLNRYVGPWARVQKVAESGGADIIAGIYKSPEREQYLDFVPTPFIDNASVVFVKKGKEFPFTLWEDLLGKTGGAILGDKYSTEFEQFLASNRDKITLERTRTVEQNFRKLLAERIDFIAYSKYVGLATIQRMGIQDQVSILPNPVYTGWFYVAIAKTSNARELLPKFNALIQQYRDDGTIDKLTRKHLAQFNR